MEQNANSAEKIGARIRELRKRKGWSQDGLAWYAGISRTHIFQMETGRRGDPKRETLEKLARALETTPWFLEYGLEVSPDGTAHEAFPSLQVALRATSELSEDDIDVVVAVVERLERRRQEEAAQQENP